jgi:RHS repeat-associated protein
MHSSNFIGRLYVVMMILLSAVVITPGASLAEEPAPEYIKTYSVNMGGGSGNGGGSGTVTPDLFTGTMSYSIPIAVPEGRKGMSPGLSLDHRSNNGDGWVGVGWELEVGAIERSMKNGLSYTGYDYILRIAGGTVDLVQTAPATNEYRAKIEGGFYRIKKKNGSNGDYWEVTDKAGVRYYYGQTFASRQDDPADASKIFKWCLDKVEDTNGNFMTIKYTKTPFNTLYANYGQIYLDRIDYTGHTSDSSTANWVQFYLESRTDASDMYSTKFKVKTAYRLKTIDVWNGTSGRIRTYALEYDTDPNTVGNQNSVSTGRSLLTKVQQFGKDADVNRDTGVVTGENALPATIFSWKDSEAKSGTFPTSYNWTFNTGQGTGYTILSGNFNGDGKSDIYMFNGSTGDNKIWVNNGDGTFPDNYTWQFISGLGAGYVAQLGDFNGDGKTDVYMFKASTGKHVVWINNHDGTFTAKPTNDGYGTGYASVIGDFDGDGIADIYMFNSSTGEHKVWVNNGDGTFPATPPNHYKWQSPAGRGTYYAVQLGDFNGDGKTDIYMYYTWVNYDATQIVWLNNGDGTFPDSYSWQIHRTNYAWRYWTTQLGDFNGDGKADIYMSNNMFGWHVIWLNSGDGSFPNSTWASDQWNGEYGSYYLGDFNGDGKTDIYIYPCIVGHAVWLNNGDGTFPLKNPSDPYGANFRWVSGTAGQIGVNFDSRILEDFNGDGKTDIFLSTTTTGVHNVWLNQGPYPDLLSTISNGLGGSTAIEYKPSTQYTNTLLPFPVQTVSSITTDDGHNIVSSTTYTYSGGFYHVGDQEFRGFNHVTITGPGSDSERVVSETWFHQGNDTAVDVNVPTASGGYMKGKPYRTIVSGQGQKYRETTIDYHANLSSFATNSFNPPHQVDNYVCDRGSCGIHTKTIYEEEDYDAYGNVKVEKFYADANASLPYRKVERSFTSAEANWLVGLPLTEDVYDGSGAHLTNTKYYYDDVATGVAGCNEISSNTTPSKGNITRIVRWFNDPLETGLPDPEVRMAYDDYGNLVCTRDPKANPPTVYYYDSTSTFPVRVINTLQQETKTKYYGVDDAPADKGLYGQVKSVTALHLSTDPTPPTTIMEYDEFGRKKKVTAPDTTWTSWDYIDFGTVGLQHIMIDNSTTDNSPGLTSWTYFDGLGRTYLQKQDGPGGKKIASETEYNITGTVKRTSMPYFDGTENPRYTTYTYDPMGRVTLISSPSGIVLGCYNGVVTDSIDADGHRKRETRDALGRLVKVEEYMGITYTSCPTDVPTPYIWTDYEYDVLGNLVTVKVHGSSVNTTEMKYDSLGRKYDMQDPDMGHWTYKHDVNGNLWKQTDANANPVTITFDYDELNRVKKKVYPTGTNVEYTYDDPTSAYPVGRLTKMTDASGTTTYNYDLMGRPASVKKRVDGVDYTITAGYENGRVASVTYPGPDGDIVRYSYGTGGELSAVRNGALTYAYAVYPAQDYTALMQPKTVINGNGVSTVYDFYPENSRLKNITTSTSAEQLLNLTYEYTDGGNVKSIADNLNPNISSMAVPGLELTYLYEGPKPHAVTSSSDGITYEYDDNNANGNGNMTFDGVRRINYDYDNMPQSMVTSLGTTTFVYDGAGARVKKTGPNGEMVYIGKLYECKEGTCTKYIYAGGARIAAKTGGDTIYYHQDHLGSSKAITGDTGENLEQMYYDPFGATSADLGALSVSHKYTSQEEDAETGLYYYNARYYNPALGRFISPDTIVPDPRNSQAYNRYSYVLNNPMIYTDPSGHSFFKRLRNWAKKPWHAFAIQNFGPTQILGTYYLTKSNTGRKILLAEAVIAMIASGTAWNVPQPFMVAGPTGGTGGLTFSVELCGSDPWMCIAAAGAAGAGSNYDQQSESPTGYGPGGGGTGGGGGGGGGTPPGDDGGGTPPGDGSGGTPGGGGGGITIYYGGGGTAYYGNKGNVTIGAGAILTSDQTSLFGGNYFTYGEEKAPLDGIETTFGAGAGAGWVFGLMTGGLEAFKGISYNLTVDVGYIGFTYTTNDLGRGFSVSVGGKGVGFGYYMNTTNTNVFIAPRR